MQRVADVYAAIGAAPGLLSLFNVRWLLHSGHPALGMSHNFVKKTDGVAGLAHREGAVFEFRYRFAGWPERLVGRDALMALYAGYGDRMQLHGAGGLVVNLSQTPGVVMLEYEVQGRAVGSGKPYDNRFVSVVTIQDRKIVGWRDYMDSLAAMTALT